ncbi:MAG: hypothetical protein J7501_17950 [Bdellovibrio sp.]|nr:hypothetical protein [Bdellovibrio sp.]
MLAQPALAAQSSYQSLLPVGSIKKGSSITVTPTSSSNTYFDPNQSSGSNIRSVSNTYNVTTVSSSTSNSDTATTSALASTNQLVVQQSDLSDADASCTTTGSCTLTSDVAVSKSGSFDFFNWFLNLFGLGSKPQSLVTPAHFTPIGGAAAATMEGIEQSSFLSKKGMTGNFCDLPSQFKFNLKLQCGLRMAQKAYQKAKDEGKVTNGTFVFNDFSSGGKMGRMYFLNADGSVANVLEKNPIDVAAGQGNFGDSKGSLGTPDGALVTRDYRPPRNGNIKDGIEMEGLESDNRSTLSRGVLIHGWNVYSPTEGCLGIPGTLDTDTKGRRRETLDQPPYLDQLKQGLFKNGGVMIYNFTPNRASSCSS